MLAITKRSSGPKDLALEKRDGTQTEPAEVLVKVSATGICGSDLHMYAGHGGYEWVEYPLVLGHEIAGLVTDSRTEEAHELLGQRVVVNPYKPCKNCEYCRAGEENRCDGGEFYTDKRPPASLRLGFREDGGMQEYVSVPPANLIPIDQSVTDEVAAISEAIAVGLQAVKKMNRLEEKMVAVFGPGPIGLAICTLLKYFGAKRVVLVGVPGDEDRLERAKLVGVDSTIVQDEELTERLIGMNPGYEAAIDCSGHPSVASTSLKILKKGGQLLLVGISSRNFELPMSQVVRGEIRVEGSYGMTAKTLEETVQLAADPSSRFSELIASKYPVERAGEAFEFALSGAPGKVIIVFNDKGGK